MWRYGHKSDETHALLFEFIVKMSFAVLIIAFSELVSCCLFTVLVTANYRRNTKSKVLLLETLGVT